MSANRRPLPSLHLLLLLWAAILVVCPNVSLVVTATSTTGRDQRKQHFKNSTTPNVPDRNEERGWEWLDELVDNFVLRFDLNKDKIVDEWLGKTGLKSRANNVFESEEFGEAINKIVASHFDMHIFAQEAMFKGLLRATRAEDRADMLFELGRTIGKYKTVDTSIPEKPRHTKKEVYEQMVEEAKAKKKRTQFVLGLEPHLFKFWTKSKFTPETIWEGLKVNVYNGDLTKNPGFREFIDYVTRLEPKNEQARYDKLLKIMRRPTTMKADGSSKSVPDRVIARQLVDAGAPNKADDVTTRLMFALFRDWKEREMTHEQLFDELMPSFHLDLERFLQGPMRLWNEYFYQAENEASYTALVHTILKRAKTGTAVTNLDGKGEQFATEKQLVKMHIDLKGRHSRLDYAASVELEHRSALLIKEVFKYMERNGMTADKMLDFLEIRELKSKDLMESPYLNTWMSFVIESHGHIRSFVSTDPEKLRIIALVEKDSKTMFDHLNKQLKEDELLTLVSTTVRQDSRFYDVFAPNLATKWIQAHKSSHDVFLLLKLDGPVKDVLMMNMFPIWYKFVTLTSVDDVKATLEIRLILENKYAMELLKSTATNKMTFDEVIVDAMVKTGRTKRYLCVLIMYLWSVKLLDTGVRPPHVNLDINGKESAITFYKDYISTRMDYFGKKQQVYLPEGFR